MQGPNLSPGLSFCLVLSLGEVCGWGCVCVCVVLLTRGGFLLSGDMFWFSQLGLCFWNVVGKARGAAKHPAVHRAAPTAKNYRPWTSVVPRLRNPDMRHVHSHHLKHVASVFVFGAGHFIHIKTGGKREGCRHGIQIPLVTQKWWESSRKGSQVYR